MNDHIDLLYLLSSESCRDRHDYHVSSRSHHIVWCYILLSQWRDDEACNINGKIRVVISRRAYEKSCSLFSILHLSIFLIKSNQIYLWRKNTNTNERKWNKLKATDVLPNTKARRPPKGPKMPFLSLKILNSEGPQVFPVNLAHIRSAVPEIVHTQPKQSQRQQQNLTQFTVSGKMT